MAVDEENELPEATPREGELQRQLDGIQNHVTEINRARIEVAENPTTRNISISSTRKTIL